MVAPAPVENPDLEETVGGDNTLESVLRALAVLRRRWRIIAVTVVLCLAGGAVGITTLQPYWVASTTVVINRAGGQVMDTVKSVNEDGMWDPSGRKEYTGTQKEILRSRKVAQAALDRVGLAEDPIFLGIDGISDPEKRAKRAAEIDPVERLREVISVAEVRSSMVLRISAEYPDPEVARDLANAVANSYVELVGTTQTATGVRAAKDLGREREDAEAALLEAENVLDAFKEEHAITSISLADRQNIITQNIMTLTARTKAAQAERFQVEAVYEQAKRLHKKGSLAGVSLLPESERGLFDQVARDRVEAERAFTQAKERYLPKHPEYARAEAELTLADGKIKSIAGDLMDSLEAKRRAARSTEAKLESALGEEKTRALELSRLEPEYRRLERDATQAAETFGVIAKRDAEVGMTNRVEASAPVEILDAATAPDRPVRPRKALLIGLAFLAGIGIGAALAVAVDLRDQRIRGLSDLERAVSGFGIPVLGHVPLLPADPSLGVGNVRAQRRNRDLHSFLHPQSQMAERIRGLRTAIKFAISDEGPTVLLVTSAGSGEGKSSIAINLALSFCQAGMRVALVDADMRRPRLHHVFPPPVESADIGLSAVLSGQAEIDDVVQREFEDAPSDFAAITCGAIPDNPAELLGSAAFLRFVAGLRERFDAVIIDSPPLLPVTDPLVAAPSVDGVLLVAKCQSTTRAQIQEAISVLRRGDTNLLGVILNEVDGRARGNGYGYGYGHYGSEYYAYRPREAADDAS